MRITIQSALTAGTVTLLLIGATPAVASPYFLIDSESEWQEALSGSGGSGMVMPMTEPEWSDYMAQWHNLPWVEGEPYPDTTFIPARLPTGQLYVYGGSGGGGPDPDDAGLVMVWGASSTLLPGLYSSAWKFEYGLDPDLTGTTITVTVTAPRFDLVGNQINNVSFGIRDALGAIRSWQWQCGPLGPIPWNVPTTITIQPTTQSVNATTPVASGFLNNPMFNITQSVVFIVDGNAKWVDGPMPVPPPGGQVPVGLWNYWHNLVVTPMIQQKPPLVTKWSQPPVLYDGPGHNPQPVFYGWDEKSLYHLGPPILADDWRCSDPRPVTDIHWWGSFIGWTQPDPPQMPDAFHIGIWTDVPAGANERFSHPGRLIWEQYCTDFTWNFAGYDHDPRGQVENEACFQFNQYLNPDEYFYQEPGPDGNIYWISIAAIYQNLPPAHPWGWKTRPHFFQDDAVRIWAVFDPTGLIGWPPALGWSWAQGQPIEYPEGTSWDLAFELSTTEGEVGACCYEDPGGPGIQCAVTDKTTCEQQLAGSWKGPGTDCSDLNGNGIADICEEQPTEYEYGDAPEGTLAYPASGVNGNFPTCRTVPLAPWIQHTNFGAWLGPQFDFEPDGNAGLCPVFNPYDADECFQDGDAGLMFPPAYTINAAGNVVLCPMAQGAGSLGQPCQNAVWGVNIDVDVHNHMPSQSVGYLNVLIDWDQNGQWGGASPCPLANAPEHVLVNYPIPNPFDGPVSALMPAGTGFLIGPNAGEVWMRVSITERPVPLNWDGAGAFEDGETEDYLLNVEQPKHDLGDAPDSTNSFGVAMTAYPPGGPPGVQAHYPTVFAAGSPPFGPIHLQPHAVAFLGNAVTLENEADTGLDEDPTNNIIPLADAPDKDGADDGLLLPLVFPHCQPAQFNYVVTVTGIVPTPLYVNAWCDWNRDGDWDDVLPCSLGQADEWAVQNQMLSFLEPGIYILTTPPFLPWHPVGAPGERLPLWMRITLSEQPWQASPGIIGYGGCGPAAGYQFGETEDYFVTPEIPEPPKAIAWRSVRNHGPLGPLAIDLDPSATGVSVKSEARRNGIQLIEVDFDQAVVLTNPGGITVTDWPGGGSYIPTSVTMVDADTLAIGFAVGLLPDRNCYRIDLDSCVQSPAGLPLAGDTDCWVRALVGDVNNDGRVSTTDIAFVKSRIGQSPALPGNARFDINTDGNISTTDIALVKSLVGNAAACP
ncbi:MAG: DUF7901 domain-containing protein [Phycisphaerae bacterium]